MGTPRCIDITGRRFGRLVVEARVPRAATAGSSPKAFWRCRCDCGTVTEARGADLRAGQIRSCGCLRKIAVRAAVQPAEPWRGANEAGVDLFNAWQLPRQGDRA